MIRAHVFIFGVLIPLAILVLVAYGFWELGRSRIAGAGDGAPGAVVGGGAAVSGPARSILDERFARGDIDADEYVRRRALLDGTVPSPPADPHGSTVSEPTASGGAAAVEPVAETSVGPADAAAPEAEGEAF